MSATSFHLYASRRYLLPHIKETSGRFPWCFDDGRDPDQLSPVPPPPPAPPQALPPPSYTPARTHPPARTQPGPIKAHGLLRFQLVVLQQVTAALSLLGGQG